MDEVDVVAGGEVADDDAEGVGVGVAVVVVVVFVFFFFSSRRRHTMSSTVSWARRCVLGTAVSISAATWPKVTLAQGHFCQWHSCQELSLIHI